MVYFVPICTLLGKNDNKCPFTMSYWCLIYCFQISSNNLIMVKLTYISTYIFLLSTHNDAVILNIETNQYE